MAKVMKLKLKAKEVREMERESLRRYRLSQRYYAMHRTRSPICAEWEHREDFIAAAVNLPGYDHDKIVDQGLTLIRVGSTVWSPETCIWVEGCRGALSMRTYWKATHLRSRMEYAVLDMSHFCKMQDFSRPYVLQAVEYGTANPDNACPGWHLERLPMDQAAVIEAATEGRLFA